LSNSFWQFISNCSSNETSQGFLTKEQLDNINELTGFAYKDGHGEIIETSK